MRKRKRYGKGMGIFLLAAVLVCGAVQPVFAEENGATDPNQKEVEEVVDTGELSKEKELNTEKIPDDDIRDSDSELELQSTADDGKGLPCVTADSVTWEGGLLKVPIDLGDYSADQLFVTLYVQSGNTGNFVSIGDFEGIGRMTLEENYAMYSPISGFWSCDKETFWTNAGTYSAKLEFRFIENNYITSTGCEDSFSLIIPSSNRMWQVEKKEVKFDGSENLTFSFANGTNYFELKSISHIELFLWKGSGGKNPDLESGFSFDMSAGTLTLEGNVVREALIKAVQDAQKEGLDTLPSRCAINVYAVASSGEEIRFNVVDREENDGGTTVAWELDLTDFNWTAEELKIVPEATDSTYIKGSWDGATIKCTGALEDFVSVLVDGTLVDRNNYTLESGSTILTFTPSYMNTLSAGKHAVTMNYTYGSVNTELTVQVRTGSGGGSSGGSGSSSTNKPDVSKPTEPANSMESTVSANGSNTSGSAAVSVQTGDSTTLIVWVLAAVFAAGVCGVLGWKRYSGRS